MQLKHIFAALGAASIFLAAAPMQVVAAEQVKATAKKGGKTFGEEEFLQLFQNRSRKQVSAALGKPLRVGQGSKPSGTESTLGRPLNKKQVDNVEMWYYEDKVRYDPKHTYKTVELTFVNDRCLNITYFNNR